MSLSLHQQFYEIVQNSQRPLIIFRKEHNADTIASSLAMAKVLQKLGKPAEIISENFTAPAIYKFLPNIESIKNSLNNHKKFTLSLQLPSDAQASIEHTREKDRLHISIIPEKGTLSKDSLLATDFQYKHDLIISLNTPDIESLGAIYRDNPDFFYQSTIINIDHLPENEHYGQFNLVNLKATSVSEILYDLLENLDANFIDETIATYLLTGMIEKTKSFKVSSVTPQSLSIASRLMASGGDRDTIIKHLYQSKSVQTLRLWGKVLLKLKTNDNQKVAWAEVSQIDFNETQTSYSDLYGVID